MLLGGMFPASIGSLVLGDLRFTVYDLRGGWKERRKEGIGRKANRNLPPPRGGQGVKIPEYQANDE
jgi:hypothetical protein